MIIVIPHSVSTLDILTLLSQVDGTAWMSCLFDHMHSNNPDLQVAHTIRELALCRYYNYNFR